MYFTIARAPALVAFILSIGILLTGCDALISTESELAIPPASDYRAMIPGEVPFWFVFDDDTTGASVPTGVTEFAAQVRIRHSSDSIEVRSGILAFPDSIADHAGNMTRPYRFALSGNVPLRGGRSGESPLTHIFTAEIPDVDAVKSTLDAWLSTSGDRSSGCTTTQYTPDDPEYYEMECYQTWWLECWATVCKSGGGSDDWPPPSGGGGDGGGGGEPPPGGGGGGGDGGGGDGGGGECDPTEITCEPDPEPCDTGDPIIDDEDVQSVLQVLWDQSNFDAAMQDRIELGMWITQSNGEYGFHVFPMQWGGPCHISVYGDPPEGTIAWAHTHPYKEDDLQTECDPIVNIDQFPQSIIDQMDPDDIYQTYDGKPSDDDRDIAEDLGIPGYMIDYHGVTRFNENEIEDVNMERCGNLSYP